MPRVYTRKTLRELYDQYVDVREPDECWPWTGARDRDGYGKLVQRIGYWRDGEMIPYAAHVLAFTFAHGHPPKHQALHTCNHEWCCNPAHVYDGTPAHNAADRVANGRLTGRAKLTVEQVQIIRRDHDGTMAGWAALAAECGVSVKTIENVVKRRTWRDVPDLEVAR